MVCPTVQTVELGLITDGCGGEGETSEHHFSLLPNWRIEGVHLSVVIHLVLS